MDKFGKIVSVIDQTLNTREKRHVVGGILMSISLLFGGLAITVISLRSDNNQELEIAYPGSDKKYIIQTAEEE